MKLSEVSERLANEFPQRKLSFDIQIYNYDTQLGTGWKGRLCMWDSACGYIDCDNLEDGIQRLKAKIAGQNAKPKGGDIEIEL